MSDVSQGPGWWLASDGKWYPPHTAPQATLPPDATSAYQGADPSRGSQGSEAGMADPLGPTTTGDAYGAAGATAEPQPGLTAALGAQTGVQGAASQPYQGQPYGSQPYAGQPYPGQPYAGQPYAGQPHPGPATAYSYPSTATPGTDAPAAMATGAVPGKQARTVRGGGPRWQPWLALAGIALVLWGAGQGLLTWSEWHLVQAQFAPYGTVAEGHLGMALTAAGEIIAGLATTAVALVMDRR